MADPSFLTRYVSPLDACHVGLATVPLHASALPLPGQDGAHHRYGSFLRRNWTAGLPIDGLARDCAAPRIRRARATVALGHVRHHGSNWPSALFYDPVHVGAHAYWVPKLIAVFL